MSLWTTPSESPAQSIKTIFVRIPFRWHTHTSTFEHRHRQSVKRISCSKKDICSDIQAKRWKKETSKHCVICYLPVCEWKQPIQVISMCHPVGRHVTCVIFAKIVYHEWRWLQTLVHLSPMSAQPSMQRPQLDLRKWRLPCSWLGLHDRCIIITV